MKLAIVSPCFNEEEVLPETVKQLDKLLENLIATNKISSDSRIYFIDDGSRDETWSLIEKASESNPHIIGIKLARNVGHQNALLAGLFLAQGDAVVSIDADLQDDISVIEEMVAKWNEGYQIVYGVRKERKTDTVFKRKTAELFYTTMKKLGADVIHNHADYRLMSRNAIEALKKFREVNLFLRGMVPLIGLKQTCVYYARNERFAGESKYPLRKMLAFAWQGITSFSIMPLRIISYMGFVVFLGTLILSLWVFIAKTIGNQAVPGWASTVLPIYLLGGIQIFCIGIIGEYLGKIYSETKARPRYVIEKISPQEESMNE